MKDKDSLVTGLTNTPAPDKMTNNLIDVDKETRRIMVDDAFDEMIGRYDYTLEMLSKN